ncbi:MAG TPA: hypothetical protein VJ779_14155 [Acetobacteraceae bacterium]|nr:hypothetical protein [Acetobacteraceae bacterium]
MLKPILFSTLAAGLLALPMMSAGAAPASSPAVRPATGSAALTRADWDGCDWRCREWRHRRWEHERREHERWEAHRWWERHHDDPYRWRGYGRYY